MENVNQNQAVKSISKDEIKQEMKLQAFENEILELMNQKGVQLSAKVISEQQDFND